MDWGSTALWVPNDSGGISNVSTYERYKLPEDFIRRMKYWAAWFDNRRVEVEDQQNQIDDELFEAYGLSIAIDLKRLKHDHKIFYGHPAHNDCVEITLMLRNYDAEYVPWVKSTKQK